MKLRWLVDGVSLRALAACWLLAMATSFVLARLGASTLVCIAAAATLGFVMFATVPRWRDLRRKGRDRAA